MKVKQLSLFLENRPAHLKVPCRILAEAGISILTLSLADTEQFGILRIIVQDWEGAKAALEEAGAVVKITDVLAVEVPNRPGGLADLLDAIDSAKLNIEYMYAFTFGRRDSAIMVFRFEDPDAALQSLQQQGVGFVGINDLTQVAQ